MPIYEKQDITKNKNDSINYEISKEFKNILGLEREPVGIEFYYSKEEYENSSLEETKYRMAYCVFVEKASRNNLAAKTVIENHYCDGATTALGLEDPNDEIKSGRVYYSYGLYKTRGIAQKVWSEVPAFPSNGIRLYGIGIAPLKDFDKEPDLIIIVANAQKMMKIIQAEMYNGGRRMNLNLAAMQGLCSEVTVIPYLTGEINISMLCPSTRTLAKWDESELAAGIPYAKVKNLIEGIKEVNKVG